MYNPYGIILVGLEVVELRRRKRRSFLNPDRSFRGRSQIIHRLHRLYRLGLRRLIFGAKKKWGLGQKSRTPEVSYISLPKALGFRPGQWLEGTLASICLRRPPIDTTTLSIFLRSDAATEDAGIEEHSPNARCPKRKLSVPPNGEQACANRVASLNGITI